MPDLSQNTSLNIDFNDPASILVAATSKQDSFLLDSRTEQNVARSIA